MRAIRDDQRAFRRPRVSRSHRDLALQEDFPSLQMEGVASEAGIAGGPLGLDNLCWIYATITSPSKEATRLAFPRTWPRGS